MSTDLASLWNWHASKGIKLSKREMSNERKDARLASMPSQVMIIFPRFSEKVKKPTGNLLRKIKSFYRSLTLLDRIEI